MRFVLLSDTHCQLDKIKVPDGDILLHAGDATCQGNASELSRFNMDLAALPHPLKFFVPGNHDKLFEQSYGIAKQIITQATVLTDEGVYIDPDTFSVSPFETRPSRKAIHLYMSPWQPAFSYGWAFNLKGEKHAKKIWERIPDDTDILVTHGPPHGIMDGAVRGHWEGKDIIENTGCEILLDRIKVVRPKLCVWGHIHEARGREERDGTIYVNASNCTEHYDPVNKPIVVDL